MARKSISPVENGVRAIAVLEGAKGVLVLLVGGGLLAMVHTGAQDVGEKIVSYLHMNPARHYPKIFLRLLAQTSDHTLHLLALGALGYSTVRFIECYGLWNRRSWAEWFAIISGGMYLPYEFLELYRSPTGLKLAITVFNIAVVVYLYRVRLAARGREGVARGTARES